MEIEEKVPRCLVGETEAGLCEKETFFGTVLGLGGGNWFLQMENPANFMVSGRVRAVDRSQILCVTG